MIGRSIGIGMIGSDISCINTNSTQISIARTTVTVCHQSQRCWFQFRKTTKCFERDKVYINVNYRRQTSINQNFVCICSVNFLCYLFGEIYLFFSWIVQIKKKSPDPWSHTVKSGIGNDREKVQKSAWSERSAIRSRSSNGYQWNSCIVLLLSVGCGHHERCPILVKQKEAKEQI